MGDVFYSYFVKGLLSHVIVEHGQEVRAALEQELVAAELFVAFEQESHVREFLLKYLLIKSIVIKVKINLLGY